jgi:HK97 family phage major capsid protein
MDKNALQKAAASQVEGTDAAGGYLVLDAFDEMITKTARENSVMMALCQNRSLSSSDVFKWNKQLANVVLTWDSEGSVTGTSGTYSQGSAPIKRLSGYVSIANELLQDSAYDIVADIVEQFGYAMGQEIDNQILNGTGSPCSGVLTAAAGYSVVMATGLSNFSSVTAQDYSLMISKLASNDASQATFVLGKLAAHYVRTLKDENNTPIYQAVSGANLDTIYGIMRTIANKITDTTGASTAFAALGNFREFVIVNRLGGLELLVDPYSDSISYNTRFIWATRKGLALKRASAFVRLLTAS